MRRRLALFAALAGVLLALSGATAGATNLYAPNYAGPDAVSGYAVAPDGSLSHLAGSPFALPPSDPAVSGVVALAFTPDGGRAVATFLFNGGIRGLAVAPDGSITPAGDPIETPSVQGLAVSPDGRFAYAPTRDFMSESARGILGYSIEPSGSLSPIGEFGSGQFGDLAITPDGGFLYALGAGLTRFAIDHDGTLTPLGSPMPVSARYLAVSPDGRFLFAADTTNPDAVTSFSIGPDGSLSQNGPRTPIGGNFLRIFAAAPDGRHIYAPDTGLDGIVTIAVGADGGLTVVDTMPATNPESVAVSHDGRFLYHGYSGGPGQVSVASIGTNGVPTPLPFTAPWSSGEPLRMVVRPAPAPTARFSSRRAAPGAGSSFDARGSNGAARFDWDFGDGTTLADGGPTPTHRYANAGVYQVRVTMTDANGCSTRQIYTGQSTVCPGGSSATTTTALDTLPALSGLSVTNKRFAVPSARRRRARRGTAFRYTLSEAARVTFTIRRRTTGRRVGRTCRPATRRNRRRRKCTLFRRVGSFSTMARQGRNRTRFSGKLRRRRLRPGSYRATAVATDSAGGRSEARSVSFRVVRR